MVAISEFVSEREGMSARPRGSLSGGLGVVGHDYVYARAVPTWKHVDTCIIGCWAVGRRPIEGREIAVRRATERGLGIAHE